MYLLRLFIDYQRGKGSVHFYTHTSVAFKAISLASFIQILFIYK